MRGESGLSFVFAVNKPAGITSHDVVNRCRRVFGERRIGHFGTLDPLAEGVILLGVGSAARLDQYLVEHDKSYVARLVFGEVRDSDDAEGSVTETRPIPPCVTDAAYAESVLSAITGQQMQVPPAFSAIKHGGVSSHVMARKGQEVTMEPRPIEVYEATLLSCDDSSWTVAFRVSKGTYIRALARDIGRTVGCGAYLGGLLRDTLGGVALADCIALDDITSPDDISKLDPVALLGFPVITVSVSQEKAVANGNPIPAPVASGFVDGQRVCLVDGACLRAVSRYDASAQLLRCETLFNPGVRRG